MAAPERFADKSDSSCTAGAVHTWPIAAFAALQNSGRYWSNNGHWPELARNGSVANDPPRKESVRRSAPPKRWVSTTD
jgi:hypothetical protein